MTFPVLRDDALAAVRGKMTLLVNLPWIRSLPVGSLRDLAVTIDDRDAPVGVRLHGSIVDPKSLAAHEAWWFVQDRLALALEMDLSPGPHTVGVSFRLQIPYLSGGSDEPLLLPFSAQRMLTPGEPVPPSASRIIGEEESP